MTIIRALHRARGRGVSHADVLWCYRTLLGREPESEEVVRMHMGSPDMRNLVQTFLGSDEYRGARARRSYHPFPLPAARIDVHVDAGQLTAAVAKVRAAWGYLGEQRPHHSVLTHDAFLPQNLAGSIGSFWASGDEEAADVLQVVRDHGIDPHDKTGAEYGCGVGRVTGGLARQLARVHAYDLSPGHLAQARVRMNELGLDNVELLQCTSPLPEALQPCDILYSRIVFQHNPPPLMLAMVQVSLRALRPGGLAIFQLPTYRSGYSFEINAWLAAPERLDMEMHCLPMRHVLQAITQEACLLRDLREDDSPGDARFISNTFVVQRPAAADRL
jgi:SAM-dependent methyltransferase